MHPTKTIQECITFLFSGTKHQQELHKVIETIFPDNSNTTVVTLFASDGLEEMKVVVHNNFTMFAFIRR